MSFSSSKPRRGGIVSLLSLVAIFFLAAPAVYADAVQDMAHAREHGRMIRKRVPLFGLGDSTTSSVASTTSSVASTTSSSSVVTVSTTSSSTISTTSTTSSTSSIETTSSAVQNSTVSTTSSVSTTSTTSILSTSTTSSKVSVPTTDAAPSTSTLLINVSHTSTSATATSTSSPNAIAAASSVAVARKTVVALIAIAGSIGVAFLIWTGIRKWKFRPSRQFEDRMNDPINWQPNNVGYDETDPASRIAAHRRGGSNSSHNSFGSSEMQHSNSAGGTYGATAGVARSMSGRTNATDAVPSLPPHDFTVGANGSDAYNYYHTQPQHGTSSSPPQMVENGLTRGNGARPVSMISQDPYGGFEDDHESNGLPPHHGGGYATSQAPSYHTRY